METEEDPFQMSSDLLKQSKVPEARVLETGSSKHEKFIKRASSSSQRNYTNSNSSSQNKNGASQSNWGRGSGNSKVQSR
jgi:hypothetical protein